MTNGPRSISIAILCDSATRLASIAPFHDLAALSRCNSAEWVGQNVTRPRVDIQLVYDDRSAAAVDGAMPINLADSQEIYDCVVAPAGNDPDDTDHPVDPAVVRWVKGQHQRGALIAGIGSGVLALAAAGLLDGRPASVPSRYAQLVKRHFREIHLAHVAAIAQHENVISAAEIASVFALTVAIARNLHSHGLGEQYRRACGIAESAVPGPSPLPTRGNQDMLVAEARAWIVAHMGSDLGIDEMAAALNVNARTFCRRFERAMGTTPIRYLRQVRLDAACSMLQRTRFSIEQIAHIVGYRDVGSFRELFRKEKGCSPSALRMGDPQQLN